MKVPRHDAEESDSDSGARESVVSDPGAGKPRLCGGVGDLTELKRGRMRPFASGAGRRRVAPVGAAAHFMIIDLHTQVWASVDQLGSEAAARLRQRWTLNGTEPIDATPAAHEAALECVDGSVVLGYRAERLGACVPNEFIAEYVSRDPGHRVGIAGIDPMAPDATDQLAAAVALGLAGVNVSPANQGFHPAHTSAMRIYERCAELRLPVFVTVQDPLTPGAELEFARPCGFDEVARAFPELRIVIGQLGHPFVDETLALIGKHEHLHACISGVASRRWQLYNVLLNATALGVMGKLLFGSGFPYDDPARAIESLYTVNAFSQATQLPSVARSSVRAIIEHDPLASLGIEAEMAPRRHEAEPEVDDSDETSMGEVIVAARPAVRR